MQKTSLSNLREILNKQPKTQSAKNSIVGVSPNRVPSQGAEKKGIIFNEMPAIKELSDQNDSEKEEEMVQEDIIDFNANLSGLEDKFSIQLLAELRKQVNRKENSLNIITTEFQRILIENLNKKKQLIDILLQDNNQIRSSIGEKKIEATAADSLTKSMADSGLNWNKNTLRELSVCHNQRVSQINTSIQKSREKTFAAAPRSG